MTGQPTVAWGLTGSCKTEYVPYVKGLVVNWEIPFQPFRIRLGYFFGFGMFVSISPSLVAGVLPEKFGLLIHS